LPSLTKLRFTLIENRRSKLNPAAALPEPTFDVAFADEDGAERQRFILSKDARFRLDKYLQSKLKGVSRNKVQQLIDLGGVTVNGQLPKASLKLREGDVVDVILPPRPATYLKPQPIPLHILYEDDDLIVINKQAGLIVHPARGKLEGTLLNALAWHFTGGDQAKINAAKAAGKLPGRVWCIGWTKTRPA